MCRGLLALVLFLLDINGFKGQEPIEAVPKYNLEKFNEAVSTKNHYVLFFVPWNGDSKSVAPIWEELGQKYNNRGGDDLILAKVDCVADVELCAQQNVTDYPTVKFYKFGTSKVGGVRFRGVRDFHSLEQFLNTFINPGSENIVYGARVPGPPPVVQGLHLLIDDNFDEVVQNGNTFVNFCAPWSSRCMDLEEVWPEVARHFQYDDDVTFGQLDCTMYKSKCNEHKVRGYPSLIWMVDGAVVDKYSKKEMDVESLKAFVYAKLGRKEIQKKITDFEDGTVKSAVLHLDQDTFDLALEKYSLIFANFHTPWCTPCQKLDPRWEELGERYRYKKEIKIAKVDCTRNKALCEANDIVEYPTMNVYEDGKLKIAYTGEMTTEDLIGFSEKLIMKDSKDEL